MSVSTTNPAYVNAVTLEGITFSNLKYTEDPVWTQTSDGVFTSTNGYLEKVSGAGILFTTATQNYGDWSFDIYRGAPANTADFYFMIEDGDAWRSTRYAWNGTPYFRVTSFGNLSGSSSNNIILYK
jgi:hypothetical protein